MKKDFPDQRGFAIGAESNDSNTLMKKIWPRKYNKIMIQQGQKWKD